LTRIACASQSRGADQAQAKPFGRRPPDEAQVRTGIDEHTHRMAVNRTSGKKLITFGLNGDCGDVLYLTTRVRG
jgi:hypothetical protein